MKDCKTIPLNVDDEDVIICRCEEVTKKEIINAIKEGYTTVHDIRKRTRAGMGFCQGKTCSRLLQQIINEYTDIPNEEIEPARVRPPVRPLAVEALIKGGDVLCKEQQK